MLALRPGAVVSADSLIDTLWGEAPPPTAATALQGHISQLRKLLGIETIATRGAGYALTLDPAAVDATRFERLLAEGHVRAALALWRGPALSDVVGFLKEDADRLDELRLVAREQLFDAEIERGRHAELVAELEAFAQTEPTRERPVAQLMLALYRSGRQADALAAYRRFRQELNAMLGLEPTETLRELERQILLQDPALAPPTAERPEQPRRFPVTVAAVAIEADAALDAEAYAQATGRAREAVRLVLERHGATVERAGTAVVGLFTGHEDDAARALAAVHELGLRAGVASGDSFAGETAAVEHAIRLLAEGAVDELTIARARPRDADRALAGRDDERRRLRELYDDAMLDKRSALVTLVGPAGIGKSRLAEDLAASVPTRVLRARCLSYGDAIGMLPAADLIRAAAGPTPLAELLPGGDLDSAAVEQLLGVLTGDTTDPVGWAVRRLLEAVAPALVIVEDLHWATPAFLEVVERLAEPVDAPLFVVATSRDARDGMIELGPLTPDACAQIVADMAGDLEPDALIERSGGNPLFLEELVHHVRASGTDALPPSLRSLLAARVERLPERERDLLTRASVLGKSFTLAWLTELADDVEEPLAALIADGLLQPAVADDDLEFRHILIRDAAYDSLPLALKAELHDRVATHEIEGLAVHHLDQAYRARVTLGEAPSPDALAERTAALGHTLLAHGDAAAASSLLARALELEPNRALTIIELGRARFDGGELVAAEEAFARVDHERARVGLIEVRLHTDPKCDLEAAGAELDRLLATLHDDDAIIEALLARAYVSLTRGHIAELAKTLENALVVAQRAGRSRAEAETLFLVCGASWYGPLPVADAIARCERVLAGARDRPIVEAAALQALGVLRAMAGDVDVARQSIAVSRSIKREIGQELGAAASAIDDGLVELLAGDFAAAEAAFRDGQAQLERLGEKGYFSTLTALLAKAVEAQGRPEEACELARASAAAAAPDDVASQVHWRAAEARALGTKELAREAVALAEATDFTLLRADAWSALGEIATAVAILEQKGLSESAIRAWCGATSAAAAGATPGAPDARAAAAPSSAG
jgi:DNA-binding SARP family transcriptional activator